MTILKINCKNMRKIYFLVIVCVMLVYTGVSGQTTFFSKPWENKEFPIVIDAYEQNTIVRT